MAQSFYDDGSGGQTRFETAWLGSSIIVSALRCTNVPTLSGYDTTCGASSSVTITYQLCTQLDSGLFFVLQFPKRNSPYESFGASGSLTQMFTSATEDKSAASVRDTSSGNSYIPATLKVVPS